MSDDVPWLTIRVHLIPIMDPDNGGYWATTDEHPGAFAAGETLPELFEALTEAIEMVDP